ncbi:MAG: hypothetical protein JNL67_14875 [Planctomycetaceae bacterium]|nr:hypothetical protein [Planctomycetaceae bacterium]
MRSFVIVGLSAFVLVANVGCPQAEEPKTPKPDQEVIAQQVAKMATIYNETARKGGQKIDPIDPKQIVEDAKTRHEQESE